MVVAIAIGVPLGIFLTRRPRARPWLLGFANIMQTIPSLALLGFLIPIPFIGGIGKRTAIVALVLYALLPILRNTFVGILGVEADKTTPSRRGRGRRIPHVACDGEAVCRA